jgi:hypothetical protein
MKQPEFNLKEIRFRASGIYHLCTHLESITEKQLATLAELAAKEKRTAKQNETLTELIAKRDAPDELPPGAITHLYDIYDSHVYGIREDIGGKHIEKGNLCEQDSLDLITPYFGKFLMKNERRFEIGPITGIPDALTEEFVIDTKTSWNLRTWRQADLASAYHWQLQAYMHLTDRNRAVLAYCLVDTPEQLIHDQVQRQTYYKGIIDETSDEYVEIEEQVFRNMTFADRIPAKNRVKFFVIERDEAMIAAMVRRSEMALEKLKEIHADELAYKPRLK